jgi:hypothetical protein
MDEQHEELSPLALPDEATAWRALRKFAECRVDEIAGSKAKQFRPFLNAIDDLVAIWATKKLQASSGHQ